MYPRLKNIFLILNLMEHDVIPFLQDEVIKHVVKGLIILEVLS